MQNCESVFAKLVSFLGGRFTTLRFRQLVFEVLLESPEKKGFVQGELQICSGKVSRERFWFLLTTSKAKEPSKPLHIRERKGGAWMSFLFLKTSPIDWNVSKRHCMIRAPLSPWTRTSTSSQLSSTFPSHGPLSPRQLLSPCHRVTVGCVTAPGTARDPIAQNPFQSSIWPTCKGSFVWGIPRVKSLCCFPLVGMKEAKKYRN